MEIYRLKITFPSDAGEESWSKTIDVKETCKLYQLHNYIQKLVEFDNDHLYEFFIGKSPRKRLSEIPDNIALNEIYPLIGLKLYYLFDFADCWLFQIVKSRKKLYAEKGVKYPVLVESTGVNPEQYPEYEH